MQWLLFWMSRPWDSDIEQVDWDEYLRVLSWEFFFIVIVCAVIITVLYAISTRRLRFEDLSRRFWPMRWLWLSIVSGIAAGLRAFFLYGSFEKLSEKAGSTPSALSTGFFAIVFAAFVAWLLFQVPGVTPPQFEGRQRTWISRFWDKLRRREGSD